MQKENKILPARVFDFTLFPLSEAKEMLHTGIGSNQKKLLVVYEDMDSKENLDFLAKILAAIKVDIEKDILLLKTTANQSFSFAQMQTLTPIEYLLIFGKKPADLGIHAQLTLYKPLELSNCQMLWADSLTKISSDQQLKLALWTALKEHFNFD